MPRCASRRDRDLCEHARSFATRLNLRAAPTALPRGSPRPHGFRRFFRQEAQRFVQFFVQTVKPCFLGFQTQSFDRTFFFPARSRGNPGVSRADSKHLAFVSSCVRSSVYLLLSISPRFGRARVGVHDFNPVSFQPPPHFAIFYIQVWVKDAPLNQRLTSPEVHV